MVLQQHGRKLGAPGLLIRQRSAVSTPGGVSTVYDVDPRDDEGAAYYLADNQRLTEQWDREERGEGCLTKHPDGSNGGRQMTEGVSNGEISADL